MQALQPLWSEMPLHLAETKTVKETVLNPFTDIFQTAIEAVKTTDAEKVQVEYLMATGQLDDPSALNIASAKAQLSVELLVQLRNKAQEAYNELIRMNL